MESENSRKRRELSYKVGVQDVVDEGRSMLSVVTCVKDVTTYMDGNKTNWVHSRVKLYYVQNVFGKITIGSSGNYF